MTRRQLAILIRNEQDRISSLAKRSLAKTVLYTELGVIKSQTEEQLFQALHSRDETIIQTMTEMMVYANLQARERVRKRLADKGMNKPNIDDRLALSLVSKALGSFAKRTKQGSLIPSLIETYKPIAVNDLGKLNNVVERRLQEALRESIRRGEHVKAGIARLKEAATNAGITFQTPYAYENVFRTETALAYSAGRMKTLQAPEVQSILWGFEWTAVGDARTEPECAALDGTLFSKDDPRLATIMPPRHFGCRCSLIEVFNDEAPALQQRGIDIPERELPVNPLELTS